MWGGPGVAAGSIVVDLGSGDGIVLIAAARQGAHAIGFELSRF
jgi:predicted nicotinamide N-methyase